jgi:hypothetical protein
MNRCNTPNQRCIRYAAKEGYHAFRGNYGSFEVFWNDGDLESETEGEPEPLGWYWAAGFPGCLYDAFTSRSTAAYQDARE